MSAAAVPKLMTVEEFLALPDDGVERWLIRGELREKRDKLLARGLTLSSARTVGLLGSPFGPLLAASTMFPKQGLKKKVAADQPRD